MSDIAAVLRPPLGVRLLSALRSEPDFGSMSTEKLVAFREGQNRIAGSRLARALVTGRPDRGATIRWQQVELPDRVIRVRVHRPSQGRGSSAGLPLVVQVHGGAYVGTAVQCDWANSYLAAHLPAVVVSVEHRLLDFETPLSAAADDDWEVLRHVVRHAGQWGIDPDRVAVAGESCGGIISALTAIRARDAELPLRAQVLVNPAVDTTSTALDYPSMTEHAKTPTLSLPVLELFRRLAVPEGADARAVSPLYADDLSGLAPALVVVPTLDPIADHGRTYAARLREAGTPAELVEHAGAGHAFLSMPALVRQARAARTQIADFLDTHLNA